MKLIEAKIYKYKSINQEQIFKVENEITVLVGMNEAGKTGVLEALAKFNYFTSDKAFKFDTTHDYPRKEKKALDKSKEDPEAVKLWFEVDKGLLQKVEEDLGKGVLSGKIFGYTKKYSGAGTWIK